MAHAFQNNGSRPFEAPRFGGDFGINFDTVVVSGFSRHVTPKQIVDFFTLKEGHCVCVSTKSDPPCVLLRFRSPVVAQKVLMRYNNADLHGHKLQVLPSNYWHSAIPGMTSQSTNVLPLMQNNSCLPIPKILPRQVQIPPSLSGIPPMASILSLAKALQLLQNNNLQRNAFLQGNNQTSLPEGKFSSSEHSPFNDRQRSCDKGSSEKSNKCLGNVSKNADKGFPRTGDPNDKSSVEKNPETAKKEVDIKKFLENQSDTKNLEVKGPVIRRKRLRKRQKDINDSNSKLSRTAVVCKTSSEVACSGDQSMEKSDETSLQKARKITKMDGNSLANDNDKLDAKTTIHSKDNGEELEKTKAKKDEASTDSLRNKSTTERQRSTNQGISDKKECLRSGDDSKDKREGGNKTTHKDSALENDNTADGSKKYNEESQQVTQRISNGESPTRKNDEMIKECCRTLTSKDSVTNDSSKNSVRSGQKESKESTMSFEDENNSVMTKGSNNVTGVKLEPKSQKTDSILRNSNACDGVDSKGKKMESQRSTVSFANVERFLSGKSGCKAGVHTKKTGDKDTANNLVIERKSVSIDIVSKIEEGKFRELTRGSARDPNDSASGSKNGKPLQGVDRDEKYVTSGSNNYKTGELGRNEKRFAIIAELKPVQKDSGTNVKKCACHDNKKTGCCSEFRAQASNSESKKKDLTNNINDTPGKHVANMRQVDENLASLQSDVTQKNSTSPAKKQISLNDSRRRSASQNAESGEKTNPKSSLSKQDAARKSNYRFLNNTWDYKYAGFERDRIRFRRLHRSPPPRLRSFSPNGKRVSPPRIESGRLFEQYRSPERRYLRNKSATNAADVATRKRSFRATGLVVAPPKKKRLDTKSAARNNEESRDLPQLLIRIDLSANNKIVPKNIIGRGPSPSPTKMCLGDKSIERINKTKSTGENRSIKTGSTGSPECPKKVRSADKLDPKMVVGTSFKATGLVVAPPKRRCLDNKRTVINNGKVGTKRAVKSNDLLKKNNGERYGKGENILVDNCQKESDGFRWGEASEANNISTSNAQKDKNFTSVEKTSDCFILNNEKFAGDTAKNSDSMMVSSVDKVITPRTSAKDITYKYSDNSSIGYTSSLEQCIPKKLDVSNIAELESDSLKHSESINNISTPNIPEETSVEKNYTNQNTSPTEDENSNDFAKEGILGNSASSKITMSPRSPDLSHKNNFGVDCDHNDRDTANTDGDTDTCKNSFVATNITTENNASNGGDKLKYFSPNTDDGLRDNIQKDVDMKVWDEDQMFVDNLLQERSNLKENLKENAYHVSQFSNLTEKEESENENNNQSDSLAVPKISDEESSKNNRACEIPEQLAEKVTKPVLSKRASLNDEKTSGLGKNKIALAKLKSLKMKAQKTFKKLSEVSVTTNSKSSGSHVGESPLTVPKLACESKSVDVDNDIAKSPEIQSANTKYRRIEKEEENNKVYLEKNTSKIICDKQHVTKRAKIECTSLETKSSPTCDEVLDKSTASTMTSASSLVEDLKKFEENNSRSTQDQRLRVAKEENCNSSEKDVDAVSASKLWDKTNTADISDTKQETQLWNEPFSAKDDLTIQSNSLENNQGITELTNATCDALSTGGPCDINSSSFSTTTRNGSDMERVKTIKVEQTSPPNDNVEERHSCMFGGSNDDAISYKTTSSSQAPPVRTASPILSDVKTGKKVNVEETLINDDERFSADYEQVKCDFRRTCNNLRNFNDSVVTSNANSKASATSSTMSGHVQDIIMTSASSIPTEDMNSNTLESENGGHYSQPSDDSTKKNLIHVLKETEFSKRIPNTIDSNKKLLLEESQAVLTKCNGESTVEAPEGLDSIETKLVPAAVETSTINGNESKDRLIEERRQDVCGDNEEPLNWEDVLNETMECESLIDCSSESSLDFASIDKVQIPVGNDDQDETQRNSTENDGQDVNNSNLPQNISVTGDKRKRDDEPAEVAGSKHQKRLSQSQDDSLHDAQNNDSNRSTDTVNDLSDIEHNREKRCFILKNILALEERHERETTALLNNIKMLASMDPSLTEKLKAAFEDCLAKIGQGYISELYELNPKDEICMNKQYCAQVNNGPQNKPKCKNQRTAEGKIRNRKKKGKRTALKNKFNHKEQSTAQEEATSQQRTDVGITPQNKQQNLSQGETSSEQKIDEGRAPQSKTNHQQNKEKRSQEFSHQSTKVKL